MTKTQYSNAFNMIIQAYTAGFITKDAAYDAIKKLNAEYKGKGNQ